MILIPLFWSVVVIEQAGRSTIQSNGTNVSVAISMLVVRLNSYISVSPLNVQFISSVSQFQWRADMSVQTPSHLPPPPIRFAALRWTVHESLECCADIGLAVGSMMRKRKRFEFFHCWGWKLCAPWCVWEGFFAAVATQAIFFTSTWETQKKRTPSCRRERKRERETPRLNTVFFRFYRFPLILFVNENIK